MKLLIVTQRIDKDDENLGAFYYWFERLAKECDEMVIIASFVGKTDLPGHVYIHSLGKEKNVGKFKRLKTFFELFSYHYVKSDAVFFHQIPEFVIAASPFLFALKKRSVLWYAHKSVTLRLKLAERLVDFVATSSPEGFRLPSKKVIYTGQAINTAVFAPLENLYGALHPLSVKETYIPQQVQGHSLTGFTSRETVADHPLKLITIGRISPIKNYEQIINACVAGNALWPAGWSLTIIGGPLLPRDHAYLASLKRIVEEKNLGKQIFFVGPVTFTRIPDVLGEHDVFINVSGTGSLDKAVFEAMSCGLSVLTTNEAYRAIVPDAYFLDYTNAEYIAERVKQVAGEKRPNMALREIVLRDHALDSTIKKIISLLCDTAVVTNGRTVPLYIANK